ncbi:putative NRPS [Actinoplanes missouriensis 431]|uniref:Putative NRPS n=1 Tax=Actinoplanes missouriensis (strain ATCC 14538 / DSM 43046 / CBS 188.64 / JCM 3121 / NBRC 102363 / NCIMB 12654 / NRRL B-3342 / UNCC 431) TaxID=512565 RepID=I0H616_ACTM4|nr:non-ribosomal peptide synthetase [Actinoplanes missouriensis]BAL88453.1 putative NRPS [Actinoplanes missouriensis 431]
MNDDDAKLEAARRALAERLSRNGGRPGAMLADQQRAWMLHTLDQAAPGVIAGLYRLTGPLDEAALQQALAALGAANELLRSTFHEIAGRPVRVIGSVADLAITVAALPGPDATARQSAFDDLCVREIARPFDVSTGPLLRAVLGRIDDGTCLLLLALHETIADEWSPDVLLRQLLTRYRALLGGADEAPEADGFGAAVQREREWLETPEAGVALRYWEQTLDGVPALRLRTDHPRPAIKTHRCGTVSADLPDALAANVEEAALAYATTPGTVVLAAWQAVLSRYAQLDEVAVGVRAPGATGEFGPHAGTVVIRTLLPAGLTTGELLEQVDRSRRAAATHGRMPFSRVVDALDPVRDVSRTPLFQALFAEREAVEAGDGAELSAETLVPPGLSTPYDLALTLLTGRRRQLVLTYNADLFEAATCQRMLAHLQAMLACLSGDGTTEVRVAPLASAAETAVIRGGWNATAAAFPDEPLHELIARQAAITPTLVAVSDQEEELRYQDLDERANQLAHRLLELGVKPEDRVALCLRRSSQMVVAMLGVLKAGAAYVPLDPQYPAERLTYMLTDSESTVLVSESALLDRLPADTVPTLLLDADYAGIAAQPRSRPPVEVGAGALAYIIYTSGSTGLPKGVLVAHRGVVNNLTWRQRTWPLRPGDPVLQNHPFSFDPSVWATFWPLMVGAECVISPPAKQLDPGALVRLIRDRRIVVYGAVPSVNAVLLEDPAMGECTSLRWMLSGAEPLTAGLQRAAYERLDAGLANLYGPTETTIDATFWQCPRSNDPQAAPIGRPVDNLRIYLLDPDGALVPPGVPGEICVAGVGLARGYHRRPGLTADRFIPDPFSAEPGGRLYRTGDVGRWRADGAIEFLGRVDQQVKVRGFRVELAEIESVLAMVPGVRDAVVVARPNPQGDNRLAAYVVAADPARPPAQDEMASFVADVLPAYMVPSVWTTLDVLPLTANGKVDRRALPDAEPAPVAADAVAPRTPLEEDVATAFAQVLGVERLGVHDDFFDGGGTSIMLARLASRLLAQYELQIPVHQFFRVPTVAGVAAVIQEYNRAGIEGVMSQQHATRLEEDARLDDDIDPAGLPVARHLDPEAVLLTGATGYLGAFLLADLLSRTTADVYCLVRAADGPAALERIEKAMRQYLIWDERHRSRILPLAGDLALPRFGLDDTTWQHLAGHLDVIYHNGAMVNFVYPYSALRAANVGGTHEVLRLACTERLKAVHYVSTIDVLLATHTSRPFIEDTSPLLNPVEVPGGYTGSKWVAEKIVYLAGERGVPVSIYRPGLIMSQTSTGATQTSDYLLVAFRGYLPMRILPDYPRIFDTVPVDYVSSAIVAISQRAGTTGQVFHLFNPAPVSIRRFCEWIQSFGYDFDIVPFEEARRRALEVGTDHPLYPLVPLIRDAVVDPQPSLDPAFIADLEPSLECRNTLDALAGSDVACPPMTERMAHQCLAYLVDVGFLPPVSATVREVAR